MKFTFPRNLSQVMSNISQWTTRPRKRLQSLFLHFLICLALAIATLLIANGGGPVFLIGAFATGLAFILFMRRIARLVGAFVDAARQSVS